MRILLAECRDRRLKGKSRMQVRRRHDERTAVARLERSRDFLHILDASEQAAGRRQNLLPRLRQAGDAITLAQQNLRAELLLQEPNLPADSRLRSEKCF